MRRATSGGRISTRKASFFCQRIDSEAQWIESYDMIPIERRRSTRTRPIPPPFSELLSSGIDTWDFGLTKDNGTRITGDGL